MTTSGRSWPPTWRRRRAAAPPRVYGLRGVLAALRWIVRTGSPRRYPPGGFPPWGAVSQRTRRWLAVGVLEAMAHDLRGLRCRAAGRSPRPTSAVFDGAARRSTLGSGRRAGVDGHRRRKESKVHLAVDTPGGCRRCW